jgi:hypothetical protein
MPMTLLPAVVGDVDLREHLGLQPVILVRDDAADLDRTGGGIDDVADVPDPAGELLARIGREPGS